MCHSYGQYNSEYVFDSIERELETTVHALHINYMHPIVHAHICYIRITSVYNFLLHSFFITSHKVLLYKTYSLLNKSNPLLCLITMYKGQISIKFFNIYRKGFFYTIN